MDAFAGATWQRGQGFLLAANLIVCPSWKLLEFYFSLKILLAFCAVLFVHLWDFFFPCLLTGMSAQENCASGFSTFLLTQVRSGGNLFSPTTWNRGEKIRIKRSYEYDQDGNCGLKQQLSEIEIPVDKISKRIYFLSAKNFRKNKILIHKGGKDVRNSRGRRSKVQTKWRCGQRVLPKQWISGCCCCCFCTVSAAIADCHSSLLFWF